MWPLVGYTLHCDPQVLEKQRAMARAFNLPIIWGTTPNLDGRSLSVARDANVPAIYAEYLGGGPCSRQGVEDYVEGCLNVMAHLGMIRRQPPPSRVRVVEEDPRPQSGHLQVCHPSPIGGLFQPAVELGLWIEKGRPLGRVTDPLIGQTQEVVADRAGIVILLRHGAYVNAGDALAVVLATGVVPP